MKLSTVDDNCRSMIRERNFKVYLNNPSMRAALFAPVGPEESESIGHLTESAIFSQWQHSPSYRRLRYARWRNQGEVDIVYLAGANERPRWIGEIKWSDRIAKSRLDEMKHVQALLRKHKTIVSAFFTTKTYSASFVVEDRAVRVTPSALHCYTVGRNITSRLDAMPETQAPVALEPARA
ncbi:MAG: hypothetical protein ICV68_13825 [Pyrinomonadaceae bacterium]|nr:hypothetical protein [Pyrinomonadaceae bacterium]